MRGKVPNSTKKFTDSRITPAYAGKRRNRDSNRNHRRDHPRLCGEKSAGIGRGGLWTGSPPPMRGKVHKPCPAALQKRDHPRLCGEKDIFRQNEFGIIGSPPPMRGKVVDSVGQPIARRITPAYAGKSVQERVPKRHFQGSPPPMRGKATTSARIPTGSGITPAYAGKRQNHPLCSWRNGDHPRLCGEKRISAGVYECVEGSPPPMRGKAFAPSGILTMTRITPAYAGKRHGSAFQNTSSWDHPRLCGEKRNCVIFTGSR